MDEESPDSPQAPDLPKYLLDPLEKQPPEKLEQVADFAEKLANWKRQQQQREVRRRREEDEVDEDELAELADRDISIDPGEYEDVPDNGAYITIKTTKKTGDTEYRYYYWQWREGDSWENKYIAPVNPRQ
ncbi:hypothetical protein ACOZ4N_00955 (plasmid) [Halorientalis pallida]|uniref:hypothetical protein n=1 Tax=Halorientalis pallida TaxID=2479928 RepID=UPI003C6F2E1D